MDVCMNTSDLKEQIDKLLTGAFRREFWLSVQEEMSSSYAGAQQFIDSPLARLEEPDANRLRPQVRHYMLNAAFRRAARASGHECVDAETNPKGENYVIAQSQGIKISRIGLNYNQHVIRGAKHRDLIAELNSNLEGYTPDLFYPESQGGDKESDSLGVLIVSVNPPSSMAQDRVLDIRVTVPFSNLKGYHYNQSIFDILSLYNNVSNDIVIPDIAIPQLKKRLKEREG